jgi:hypothetical protein
MYCLTIIKDEGDGWNSLKFDDFEQLNDAMNAARNCDMPNVIAFEIDSDEWISHHMMGEKQSDGYIDWIKKMEYV